MYSESRVDHESSAQIVRTVIGRHESVEQYPDLLEQRELRGRQADPQQVGALPIQELESAREPLTHAPHPGLPKQLFKQNEIAQVARQRHQQQH